MEEPNLIDEEDEAVLVEHSDVKQERGNDSITTNEEENDTDAKDQRDNDDGKKNDCKDSKQDSVKENTTENEKNGDDGTHPRPLQIVSIGTEDDAYAFTFHEEKLNEIIRKIPPGWKVAVVSVVGAFRTGKSFLLSWFLRYLHYLTVTSHEGGDKENDNREWYERVGSLGRKDGFDWRGGSERNTTGIWMWSQPHFVTKPKTEDGEENEVMAVLLVDSQGMFDNETTMSLTTSIFGLTTLLSSYQIYNVDKRIQEDNLQQLALFSEYARLAVEADLLHEANHGLKPFQKMEFLVRDWQHFEDEEDFSVMEKEMEGYLEKVLSERDAQDLQETRQQILSCFQSLSCYGLCHPGMTVIKKSYQGDVNQIEETFMKLLDRYCRRVFHADHLKPKTIHNREVTAAELAAFIKAYAEMFSTGASFPEASTMLEATSAANNVNAVNLALSQYKDTMNRIAGPKCSNYIRPQELKDDHRLLLAKSLQLFDSMATFGSRRAIDGARESVINQINDNFEVYQSLNDSRNPLAGLELYGFPLVVALVSFILRWVADTTCSPYSSVCKSGSDFFSHIFAVVVCFLFIVGATKSKQIYDVVQKLKGAFELMSAQEMKKKMD